MAKTYDAGEFTLKKLLQDYDNLNVPLFQRGYSWGKDEINELFSDAIEIDWQKLKTRGIRETHFMGAMVFCNVGGDANAKDGYNILDGQQRLTTLTMIVAAIARRMQVIAVSEKKQKDMISKSASATVYLNSIYKDEPTDDALGKLVLSPQEEDERLYQIFVSDQKPGLAARDAKRKISKAYEFSQSKIDDVIVAPAEANQVSVFDALRWAVVGLLESLSFVVIVAKDETAAFRLFETLNDRGLDLSAADLIKNKLFQVCRNQADRDAIKACWRTIGDADGVSDDLVAFFRTKWLSDNSYIRKNEKNIPLVHEFVRKDGLFEVYSDYFDEQQYESNFVSRLTADLSVASGLLSEIISPKDSSPFKARFEGLRDLGAKTCRPLLLAVSYGDRTLLPDVIDLVESLTIRWTVAKMVTNSLEVKYARVASEVSDMFKDGNGDKVLEHIRTSLCKLDVPGDEKFLTEFKIWAPANTSKLARYVLCRINRQMTGRELEVAGPSEVHVEHIFPQTPSDQAIQESAIAKDEAEEWSGLIGNLTLLDAGINMSIKNAKFSDKLTGDLEKNKKGINHSNLKINDEVKTKTVWTKAEINARSAFFADIAVKTWQWPKSSDSTPAV
jgi:hypothetical protein